jgi:glucan phosphoethanolaminetransferase (alkaline phosphatase superfamily)
MQEESEIINFVLSILLFFYFLYLLKKSELKVPTLWKYAMGSIILSNASTIIEAYAYFIFFNYVEHVLYTIAGLLFLIGAFRFKNF